MKRHITLLLLPFIVISTWSFNSQYWSYLVGRNIFHNSSTSASNISGSSGSSSFGGGGGFSGGGAGGGGR